MSITSINSNQAALIAQLNIGNANTATANNVTALSSGNRLVNASTDVAALSTGTALQSQVNTLNTALTVASQGSSLLQVADGALAQIQTILQRQQAISTSAQSGSLSDTQRGFLDQEFQNLTQQVDQLANSTNFNGVQLLNGSISQSLTSTVGTGLSTAASGSYSVTTNAANNDTLTINGQAVTFKSTATAGYVTVGSDINSTVANLVSFINNAASNTSLTAAQKTALSAVSASQVGTSGTFTLTARNGGTLGGAITLGAASGTLVVSSTGQGTGSVQAISGITTASTSTALTSVATGGFLSGGTLQYNGTTLKDSSGSNITISNTTTLQSLVTQINSGTSTSGVSAFITGSSGNYTLNLANATSSGVTATSATNSSALALSGTAAITGPITLGAYASHSQVVTFTGITSASTVLTEGDSGLKNGAFGLTGQTGTTVTLGTTTINSLASALASANAGSTAVIGADGSGNVTLTITDATNATAGLTGTSYANYTAATATGPSIGSVGYNTTAALAGGKDTGLGYNSTTAVGTSLDNIITAQNQQVASTTISYPSIQPGDLDSTSNFGGSTPASITIGSGTSAVTFSFTNNANSASNTEIQIGSNLQQTLANAVSKINAYQGSGKQNYVFNQLTASSNGNSITISGKNTGTIYQNDQSTAVTVSASGASSSVTAATLNNSSNGGVNVSGINNTAFTGTISGITATANGTANQVNLSVKIGDITYAANNVSTNPLSNTNVQLVSTDPSGAGGSFSIQLQALDGSTVNNQTDATNFASRLNTALSGLTFQQTRQITSYDPSASGSAILSGGTAIGSLNGSSISLTGSDFSNVKFNGITVAAPQGTNTNGQITFSANGQDYVSSPDIGTKLNANTSYTFTSSTDPNQTITFKTGSTSIDFSTAANAQAVQNAITSAFGSSGSAISFQVGSDSSQSIGVSIGSATSSSLFGGQSLDVKTLADATNAGNVLTSALNTVTSLRATVGALEERFTYASNAIQNAVQNEGAAQSNLLDTDVSSASTNFATSQVQLQAGIAVLAQANQLQQQLLKLIQ